LLAGLLLEKVGFKNIDISGSLLICIGFPYIWLAILKLIPASIGSIFLLFSIQAGLF
jgi:hypothetical protein